MVKENINIVKVRDISGTQEPVYIAKIIFNEFYCIYLNIYL